MVQFIQDNYIWLTPILVALVSGIVAGIFHLIKKSGSKNRQVIKNVNNSSINQSGGDVNINK